MDLKMEIILNKEKNSEREKFEKLDPKLEFWYHKYWSKKLSPWHLKTPNSFLTENYKILMSGLKETPTIFVPLCGKSVDLVWLKDQGHANIVGVEGVMDAIQEFMKENDQLIKFQDFSSSFISVDGRLQILFRSIFDTKSFPKDAFNGVWDRASLVAIHPNDRIKYVQTLEHVLDTDHKFNYLLNVVEYDQSIVDGPPYSASASDIETLFSEFCSISKLASKLVTATDHSPQKFRDAGIDVHEVLYHLTNK